MVDLRNVVIVDEIAAFQKKRGIVLCLHCPLHIDEYQLVS